MQGVLKLACNNLPVYSTSKNKKKSLSKHKFGNASIFPKPFKINLNKNWPLLLDCESSDRCKNNFIEFVTGVLYFLLHFEKLRFRVKLISNL